MESKRALITAEVHAYLSQRLEKLGFTVDVFPEIERDKLLRIIPDYTVLIITTYTKVDSTLIDKAANLKIIGRVGSGMENVDTAYCRQKNIVCVNSPEGNANAVGEHCLAMLLCLMNNITKANNELTKNQFLREANRGEELDGKTVGIIGYGHTGSAFAKKLRGFDVEILVYDKYRNAADTFVRQVSLPELQHHSDIISFHVPYTHETHHYGNAVFFAQCDRHPVIINTSRGAVLHTPEILQALESKQLKGLCIDVFEDEPLTKNNIHSVEVYQQLIERSNVIATPHIAGWTVESNYKLAKILMDKIETILSENTTSF